MTWLTTVWLRAYSRVQPCWISAICKKVLHKIYVATFNGVQKNRPKDKYYFLEIKYSKTSLATTLIWRSLHKIILKVYGLLLSQLPFSCSLESLLHQTNIRDSAVIRAHAFTVAQNVPKWRQSVNKLNSFSHGAVCTNIKFKVPFGEPPFLDPFSWKRAPWNCRRGPIWPSLANF